MQKTVASWLFLANLALPGYADIKVVSKYTADGQTTETTTYAKGERLRYQYSKDVVLLRDCVQKRITQIDEKSKTFVSVPDEAAGGTVSKLTLADTGEQKEMFQVTAHHMKSSVAAENGHGRVETDGWYIDAKEMPSCAAAGNYPLSYTVATYKDGQPEPAKVTMEVTELVIGPLEATLFDIPAGYTDANKKVQPTAQKAPGTIRVGTAPVQNKSAHGTVSPSVHDHFLSQIREGGIDVMPLAGGTAEAVNQKAQETQCDYVLYTEVASLDKPSTGKVGGLLHKTPGVGKLTGGDAMEANVSFRLVPSAGGSPTLSATATGRAGSSFNWKTAVTLATTFSPMFMMSRMMTGGAFNPAMINSLTTGHGYGASMAGMDPMMNTMSTCLQAAQLITGPEPTASQATVDHAVAAALDQEAKAILAQLKK